MNVDERRAELVAMRQYETRQRALALGYPHTASLLNSPEEVIDYIIEKEMEMEKLDDSKASTGKGKGKGKTSAPTAEERAATRAAATKGKGKGKGKVREPDNDDGEDADSEDSEDSTPSAASTPSTSGGGGGNREVTTLLRDVVNRLDNIGTFLENLSGSVDETKMVSASIEAWAHGIACSVGAIPDNVKGKLEEAREAMLELAHAAEGGDDEGNE